jgi:ribosomal protein S18 acetylase RimI-like enzyme
MARAKKDAAPADPDKLVRDKAGEYRTGDGRFTVQSQASGAWFVVDSEQLDELGMARVLGPFGTLDEAKKAIAHARSAPPVTSFLKARAQQKAKGGDGKAHAGAAVARGERREEPAPKPASKPRPPRIRYATSTEGVRANELRGFFAGWPDPPSPETLRRLLAGSDEVVLAFDDEAGTVVGFVTALTDRVLSAYIASLEVLPDYQKLGIADELLRRIVERVGDLRMIDAVPDPELEPFYKRAGFKRTAAMSIRNVRKA